jgi:hypothetical protein
MNIFPVPLLAEAAGFADAMNKLYFIAACGLALVAMLFAFLPHLHRVARWMSIGFALAGIYLVIQLVRLNSPLPWSPVILFSPVALSLAAVWQTWRALRRAK